MKNIIRLLLLSPVLFFQSCKSGGSGDVLFCDTTCMKDTLKFQGEHELEPYLYILPNNCGPDSIIWSYKGLGTNRKTKFDFETVKLNSDYIRCIFKDTGFVYLLFNDCLTGRGYQFKLPFGKTGTFSRRSSGINNLDPKFDVADNLIAFTDRGNIYVEEPATGKKAMMTFGKATDMDYDVIHETLDSVHVTPSRIWVKVKIDGKWEEKEKNITLE